MSLSKSAAAPTGTDSYAVTPHTKLKRYPARGAYDKETVHSILDEGFICHIGYVVEGQPFVTPTAYARVGETLYFHGNISNRMLKTLKVCTTPQVPLGKRHCLALLTAKQLVLFVLAFLLV